jgi:hypothetical protein
LALQEMLRLLPKQAQRNGLDSASPKIDDDDKKADGAGKGSGNSKAATVESAIEYIKVLKRETESKSKEFEAKDRECETLKKKLQDMERLLGEKGISLPDDEGDSSSS